MHEHHAEDDGEHIEGLDPAAHIRQHSRIRHDLHERLYAPERWLFAACMAVPSAAWLAHASIIFDSAWRGDAGGELVPAAAVLGALVCLVASVLVLVARAAWVPALAYLAARAVVHHTNPFTASPEAIFMHGALVFWLLRPSEPVARARWSSLLGAYFAVLYFFGGVNKLFGDDVGWRNGLALTNLLTTSYLVSSLGVYTATLLPPVLLQLASYGALVYELAGGVLTPWRRASVAWLALGVPFHLAAALLLELRVVSLTMAALHLWAATQLLPGRSAWGDASGNAF